MRTDPLFYRLFENSPETFFLLLGMSVESAREMTARYQYLIRQTESQAPAKARELISRVKTEIGDEALRDDLIEFIETVIIYKLPRLSREEIQAMLQIHDIRDSRVYQEALKEGEVQGRKEGLEEGIEKGIAIAKLAAKNMSAEEIATNLKLDMNLVRMAMANTNRI